MIITQTFTIARWQIVEHLLSSSSWGVCSQVICISEMSDCSLTQHILNIHQSGSSALWLLHGWCHMKLLLCQPKFCAHHARMHQFTLSHYLKPYTQDACTFSCNLSPALLAEQLGSFTCYCNNTGGGMDTETRVSTES